MFFIRLCLVFSLIFLSVNARHKEREQEETNIEEDTNNKSSNQSPRSRHFRQIPFNGYEYRRPQVSFDRRNDQDLQKETLELIKEIAANLNQQHTPQQFNFPPYPQLPSPHWTSKQQGHQSHLHSEILRLLDDISTELKRPPIPSPPPQVVYVPYPYPLPKCECNCQYESNNNGLGNVTFDSRFKADDPRQVWGVAEPIEIDDGLKLASRPVSFDPVAPNRPITRFAPEVQHGSKQASVKG